ncbi:Protein of uncharacterised function DUF58 [Enterococcus durans]|uniref:Protein of uncharacterized function DUF58 n=1 Tax=Enterococcus durans TaxID=53345 RepID=A0A377KNP1_9ENTE|nr:DUF58 domain-containing protein [Enterococcus durans]STP30788.1 Protein of uncharacterised function DUF58 [Enterococcus durans]
MTKLFNYLTNSLLLGIYFLFVRFAILFNNSLGWFLATFATLYLLWSFLSLGSLLRKIAVSSSVPAFINREKATVTTVYFSKARAFSIPLPRLTIRFSENFSPQQQTVFVVSKKKQEVQATFNLPSRGTLKTAPIELIAYDPLGLFRKSIKLEIPFNTTVLPRLCEEEANQLFEQLIHEQRKFPQKGGEELKEYRPYRYGDPVNRINWKLSAHSQEWLYRETEEKQPMSEISLCFWGVDDPFFEETLDIYYSFYQLVKDKNPKMIVLGKDHFSQNEPTNQLFAKLQPFPVTDEKKANAYLKDAHSPHLIIFTPRLSDALQAFSEANPKNTTVVFIYFESNHLVIQHKQARLAVKGGTKDD